MLSIVTHVLYLGGNLKLAKALLSMNPTISSNSHSIDSSVSNSFNLFHITSVDFLENTISEGDYSHFICEQPVSSSVKLRISENFPNLNCIYLNEEEPEQVGKKIVHQKVEKNSLKVTGLVSKEVKAALDCISIPIYYKNKQGQVIACNTYFSQLFGLSPDQLIGQCTKNILPDDPSDTIQKSERNCFDELHIKSFECELSDVSGMKSEYLIREETVEGGDFNVGILFDISEMNSAKRAVEKERSMLKATADISSDLIFFKDLDSRFIGCNKQFENFVGCSESDIVGKRDEDLFELNQSLACQSQDTLAMTSGDIYAADKYLTHHNGEQHYISMQKVPLKNKEGKVQGLVAIGRDITEKSIIQKQLKVANVVFENTRDALVVTDGDGVILSLNDACLKLSGASKGYFIGKKIRSFASGGDYQSLFLEIEKGLAEHGQWQGNANFTNKSGDLSYYWLEIYVVKHRETGIENRVYSFTDLTKNKHYEEKIHYLSKHDSLTGLHNRIALFNNLESAIARANHKQSSMGVMFVEIKGFKANHERYGHNQGNLVLKGIAERLKRAVSETDIIARIGNDQFVLVIEELDNEQVIALIAKNLAQTFLEPLNISGTMVHFSISIGISICPDDGVDLDSILSNAESAMLRSREDRSCPYHFYTNELTINSAHQIELENEFKLALEDDQFDVYYQPQYDLTSRQIVAVECLMRWNHPEKGLLPPNRFLMLAEQSGLLFKLGAQLFRKAALQATEWHNSGINFGRISFDLSKFELSQISLIGIIQKVMLETGCRASWLEFSIEEHLFSSEIDTIQDNLKNLSRLGISLTVDGFGADRSVLYSIGKLNIDKFKISKHFIQGVPGYLAGEAMSKSIFVLAKTLGIDVVGEERQDIPLSPTEVGSFPKEPMKGAEATFYLRCHKRK